MNWYFWIGDPIETPRYLMYIPPKYHQTRLEEVERFLEENAFGILISQGKGRPLATHIPLELERDSAGQAWLVGHVAKANPHWRDFEVHPEVLAIFNGPHAYISSSWYKEEEVPTWNYISVHVHGRIELLPESEVMASLHRLVDKYEAGSGNPLRLQDLNPKTLRQVKGIVGFRIRIAEIHAAYKLSQGRETDHPRIIRELEKRQGLMDPDIAEAMKKISKKDAT